MRRRWIGLCVSMLGLAVSAQAKTVHVQVGPNNALIFSPASVTINVGDTVEWDWVGNNHTVTSGGCCSFSGLFDLGTVSTGPPTGQNAGFAASHTFTQPGSFPYFCRVHGSNFGMTGSVTVLTPDYSISIPNSTVGPVFPGQTGTFDGSLVSQSGYSNPVAMSCKRLAPSSQPNCIVSPSSAVPSAGGTPFAVSNSLNAGLPAVDLQFQMHAAGSDGTNHDSQVLTLKVVTFDFGAVGNLTVGPSGTSAADNFVANGFNGFTGDVAFACGNLPANASCTFTPSVAHLNSNNSFVNMSLTVTTAQTPGGVYQVSVIASTAGAPNNVRIFTLTVPDYTLSVANPLITVFPGAGGSFNGTLASLGGLSGNITVTCSTSDVTVQCTSPGNSIALGGTPQNFSVTFTTTSATQPKDYIANIQASNGNGLNHAIAVTIRVVDIALGAPSASTINVAQGNPTAPVALTVSALGNWSPTITLNCGGLPTGASCAFSPGSTLTPGRNGTVNASVVILSGTAPLGQSTVTVTASAPLMPSQTFHVLVGGSSLTFRDVSSGGSPTTAIHTGDTVEWDWATSIYLPDYHSTTSGTCVNITCTAGPGWDSGLYLLPHAYQVTLNNTGSFPYFCQQHGDLYGMRGTVNVTAAPVTSKTRDITLNVNAGSGAANLAVTVDTSPATPNPAAVGSTATFNVTAKNLSGTTPVAATANVIFSGPVSIIPGNLPASCILDSVVSQAVDCSLSSANGTPVLLPIPVTVGFARSVTAQAFVSSDATETNPADNQATATVQVRPRPFSRNGLPVIIP